MSSILQTALIGYAGLLTVVLLFLLTANPQSASLDSARASRAACKKELVKTMEQMDELTSKVDEAWAKYAKAKQGQLTAEDEQAKNAAELETLRSTADDRAAEVQQLRNSVAALQDAVDTADASRDAMRNKLLDVQARAAAAEREGRTSAGGAEPGPAGPLTSTVVDVLGHAGVAIPLGLHVDPETHTFVLPAATKRVWIDVGAHKEAMYTLPSAKIQEDLLVLAFEPLYRMWAELAITNAHPRVVAFPAAVSPDSGIATFNLAGTDQCSSLKKVDGETDIYDWPGGCAEVKHSYPVPVVSLEEVIEALPKNAAVQFVKIDAQGADYDVLVSAGGALDRIENVVVEVQTNVPLYAGAHNESDFTDYMLERGFELTKRMLQGPNELNLLFHNSRAPELQPEDWEIMPLNAIFDGVYEKRAAAATGATRHKKGSLKVKDMKTTK